MRFIAATGRNARRVILTRAPGDKRALLHGMPLLYVLRIVAPDLEAFSDLMMKRLVALPGVAQVKTNIALSKIKQTHEIPLDPVARPRHHGRRVSFTG